jgi:membrane protein implicated in regulation of membrane protease activity
MTVLWIVVAIVFAVAEMLTVAFFAVFVTAAALAAAVAAALGADLLAQGIVFFAVAVGGILLARPPLMRYLRRRQEPAQLSGAQEMIGRTGLVTDPIRDGQRPGHVDIMGERWPAVSADGEPLKAGLEVRVVEIRRATLVVAP